MENAKKQVYLIIVSLLLVLVTTAGCGKKDPVIIGDIGKSLESNSLKITPKKINVKEVENKKRILVIDFEVENVSSKENLGIVADDFIIDEKFGNYYYTAENVKNFNFILKHKEKKSGTGYYLIPESLTDFDLLYLPVTSQDDNAKLIWKFEQKN